MSSRELAVPPLAGQVTNDQPDRDALLEAFSKQQALLHMQEQALRAKVKEIGGGTIIMALRSLDLSYTFRDAAFIYLLLAVVIAGSCWLFTAFGPLALLGAPLGAFVAGVAFNWINVQIHEASHGLLLRDRNDNDVYTNIVLGSLALQDVETYRATHGMHHAHLHTRKDPDRGIYTDYAGTFRSMLAGIARDLFLVTALKRQGHITNFIAEHGVVYEGARRYATVAKLAAQCLVLSIYLYFCGWWGVILYGAFYLYGLVGIFPVLVRIRTVVQHRDGNDEHLHDGSGLTFVSRTTVSRWVEFILIGARMDYHFEHHLYPILPYYNLRKLHETLHQAGFFATLRQSGGPELRTDDYLKSYATLAS